MISTFEIQVDSGPIRRFRVVTALAEDGWAAMCPEHKSVLVSGKGSEPEAQQACIDAVALLSVRVETN